MASSHRVEVDGRLCAEGSETRIFAAQPATLGTLEAVAAPEKVREALPVHSEAGW